MLSVRIKHKPKGTVKLSNTCIEGFIDSNKELPRRIRCNHLKNKPLMFLSVCLKKHFVFVEIYPECRNCKQMMVFENKLLKFSEDCDFED